WTASGSRPISLLSRASATARSLQPLQCLTRGYGLTRSGSSLRLAASSEMRGLRRVPITAISAMTGIDRKYLYAIIMGAPVSADYCDRLTMTSLIRQIEAGQIKLRRSGRYSDGANRRGIVARQDCGCPAGEARKCKACLTFAVTLQ